MNKDRSTEATRANWTWDASGRWKRTCGVGCLKKKAPCFCRGPLVRTKLGPSFETWPWGSCAMACCPALLGGALVLTWKWDGRCQHGLRCLIEPWKAAEPPEHPQCPCATHLAVAQGWPAHAHSRASKQVQGESLGDAEHPCPAPGTAHCGEGALSQQRTGLHLAGPGEGLIPYVREEGCSGPGP